MKREEHRERWGEEGCGERERDGERAWIKSRMSRNGEGDQGIEREPGDVVGGSREIYILRKSSKKRRIEF